MSRIADETIDNARRAIEAHVAAGHTPGAVALIGRGGETHAIVAGAMAVGGGAPMRRDTIFRIASVTKPIAAALALMLVEDGTIALDAPAERWLPELADRRVLRRIDGPVADTVPANRSITVEDLLTFRLGWGIVFAPPGAWPIQRAIAEAGIETAFGPPDPALPFGPAEWMRRLATLPLMAQPGEAWMYTTGSSVLGVLLARAAGRPLPELMRERIFEPLGMPDTAFHVPPGKRDRLPAAYFPGPDGLRLTDDPAHSRWAEPPAFPAADAGLVSTVDDLHRFSRFLLDGGVAGGRRLLREASVAAMTTDHLTAAQREGGVAILGPDHGWGYGLAVALRTTAAGAPAGAYGWNGGSGTSWVADPASGTTAILLTQTSLVSPDPPAIHRDFWRAVFG